jgi:uncharacterized membrane protein YdbT with pleckstrin-like domain
METVLETIIQLLPSFLMVLLVLFIFYLYLEMRKYIKLKTKYYNEKLKEIEKRNKE